MIWYYIYYRSDRNIFYERTCGTERSANERVIELKKRGKEAWWTTDVLNGAFY